MGKPAKFLGVVIGFATLFGCSGTEPAGVDLLPDKPGNYLVRHKEGGERYLTVATVRRDGKVYFDKGPLPRGALVMTARIELEQCGNIILQRERGGWLGLINNGMMRTGCPLSALTDARSYTLLNP